MCDRVTMTHHLTLRTQVAICSRYTSFKGDDAPFQEALVRQWGYPFEAHTVRTADGYLLELHRIRHGRDGPPGELMKPFDKLLKVFRFLERGL